MIKIAGGILLAVVAIGVLQLLVQILPLALSFGSQGSPTVGVAQFIPGVVGIIGFAALVRYALRSRLDRRNRLH